ncbi:MAG: sugar ABC transporter permease, partial [Candidatus Izimaplasma sp.]|nr:sugar ABC transporter permease [Candidatus Izimaplasma bacterium]
MKRLKVKLQQLLTTMKTTIRHIPENHPKVWHVVLSIKKGFDVVVAGLKKVIYALTHNVVLNTTTHHVIILKIIKFKITNKRREAVLGISFILIWIIGYSIFTIYPVFNSLYLSFHKVKLASDGIKLDPVGIDNFKAAFISDPYFVEIIVEYALKMLLNVPVVIVFALIIAMLINQDIKGKGIWRTIFFLPVIISTGPVISELMNQGATTLPSIENYDFLTLILNNIGEFIASPIQSLFDTILLVLWFAGIQILILLAGLQKIDRSIYEASMIDGASPWESFWKITLPSIMPLISVTIVYTVVSMSVFSLNEVIVYIRDKMFLPSTEGTLTTG